MRYWLMKTEPSVYGLDDLASQPNQTDHWDGVRNYQARNMMRDEMGGATWFSSTTPAAQNPESSGLRRSCVKRIPTTRPSIRNPSTTIRKAIQAIPGGTWSTFDSYVAWHEPYRLVN